MAISTSSSNRSSHTSRRRSFARQWRRGKAGGRLLQAMRSLDEIRDEVLKLDEIERGAIADALAESFMTPEELEIQQSWIEEVERRMADHEAGKTKSAPFEEVMRKLRGKYSSENRNRGRSRSRT